MNNTLKLIEYNRIKHKLPKRSLAIKLGMFPQQYCAILKGRAPFPEKHIRKVCDLFSIPVETFLYEMTKDYLLDLRKRHLAEEQHETTPEH